MRRCSNTPVIKVIQNWNHHNEISLLKYQICKDYFLMSIWNAFKCTRRWKKLSCIANFCVNVVTSSESNPATCIISFINIHNIWHDSSVSEIYPLKDSIYKHIHHGIIRNWKNLEDLKCQQIGLITHINLFLTIKMIFECGCYVTKIFYHKSQLKVEHAIAYRC